MHFQADVVAEPVWEECGDGAGLGNLANVTLENAQLEEADDGDGCGVEVQLVELDAGLDFADTFLLHRLDEVVDCRALGRKATLDGQRARYVASIALPLASRIKNDKLLAFQRLVVVIVVQRRSIDARTRNDGVCLRPSTARSAHSLEDGLDLALVGKTEQHLCDFAMPRAGDIVGATDHGDFILVLDAAGTVHGGLQHPAVDLDLGPLGHSGRLVLVQHVQHGWR